MPQETRINLELYQNYYLLITLYPGTYLLETWGAEGNGTSGGYVTGGLGGYSKGRLTLNQNTNLFVYVGGKNGFNGPGGGDSYDEGDNEIYEEEERGTQTKPGTNAGFGYGVDAANERGAGGGGWYSCIAYFPEFSTPWFIRGNHYNINGGLFYFFYEDGSANDASVHATLRVWN